MCCLSLRFASVLLAWFFLKKKHFRKDTWFSLPTKKNTNKIPLPKKLTAKAPLKIYHPSSNPINFQVSQPLVSGPNPPILAPEIRLCKPQKEIFHHLPPINLGKLVPRIIPTPEWSGDFAGDSRVLNHHLGPFFRCFQWFSWMVNLGGRSRSKQKAWSPRSLGTFLGKSKTALISVVLFRRKKRVKQKQHTSKMWAFGVRI